MATMIRSVFTVGLAAGDEGGSEGGADEALNRAAEAALCVASIDVEAAAAVASHDLAARIGPVPAFVVHERG